MSWYLLKALNINTDDVSYLKITTKGISCWCYLHPTTKVLCISYAQSSDFMDSSPFSPIYLSCPVAERWVQSEQKNCLKACDYSSKRNQDQRSPLFSYLDYYVPKRLLKLQIHSISCQISCTQKQNSLPQHSCRYTLFLLLKSSTEYIFCMAMFHLQMDVCNINEEVWFSVWTLHHAYVQF